MSLAELAVSFCHLAFALAVILQASLTSWFAIIGSFSPACFLWLARLFRSWIGSILNYGGMGSLKEWHGRNVVFSSVVVRVGKKKKDDGFSRDKLDK